MIEPLLLRSGGLLLIDNILCNGRLLLNLEELKVATGYDRPGDVVKCLRKNGVRFPYGKSGIYTTMDALNAAMGLKSGNLQNNESTEINIY